MADEHLTSKKSENVRDETLKLNKIDTDFLEDHISTVMREFEDSHDEYFQQREEYLLAMRDFRYNYREGPFEISSDLHVPFTQIMSKATHAKLFEVFSPPNLFSVESNNIAFIEREETVKNFMNWSLDKHINRGEGFQTVKDLWIDQGVKEGSGIVKLFWDRWEHKYEDVDIVTEEVEEKIDIFATEEDLEVDTAPQFKSEIKNNEKTEQMSAPAVGVVDLSDFGMPAGYGGNPQLAPYVWHRVFLEDAQVKLWAEQGRFDKDRAKEAVERRASATQRLASNSDDVNRRETPRRLAEQEGVNVENDQSPGRWDGSNHEIIEWYGRVYIEKDQSKEKTFDNMKKKPQEVVIWYHKNLRKILGWTYLRRINPSGRRPFYKWDFMPSNERAFGIGTGELLWSINNYIDAMHNLKLDNGMLSSLQFGTYRAASTMKPDSFRVAPGELVPVEDTNDVKFANFPYLGQFGESEEQTLNSYGQNLLPINDINLGNIGGRGVAGALRNATGASFVDRQSNIQLNPHISRLAKTMSDLFRDMFIMSRARMSGKLSFRVTGQDGKGIFKDVEQSELRGNFDFIIDTELAGASEAEKQQRATLMLQTLINPNFMQMGIVQPGNTYEILKKYLIVHQIRHPDTFITKPPNYTGPALSPQDRIFRIAMGQHDTPPIESTVKAEENHQAALEFYEDFKGRPEFGLLDTPDKVAALEAVIQEHTKFAGILQGAQGIPNSSGTQLPGQGLGAIGQGGQIPNADAPEGGPLGSPLGEVNGPVV